MKSVTSKQLRFVVLSLVLALMLEIFPLPSWLLWFKPAWVVLVLIYWVMVLPHLVGIGVAWCLGILLDVITGTLLGEHALALIVITALTQQFYQRMWLYSVWQQSAVVFSITLLYECIILWIQGMIGQIDMMQFNWFMPLCNGLLWPAMIFFNEEQWRVIHADMRVHQVNKSSIIQKRR